MHWQWLAGLRAGKVMLAYWQPVDGIIGDGRVRKKGSACKKKRREAAAGGQAGQRRPNGHCTKQEGGMGKIQRKF